MLVVIAASVDAIDVDYIVVYIDYLHSVVVITNVNAIAHLIPSLPFYEFDLQPLFA